MPFVTTKELLLDAQKGGLHLLKIEECAEETGHG